MSVDVAVVGGGIIGLATALALVEQCRRSVVVIEAEDQLALHQTSHNSGVIHSGLYYRPTSLKARLCRTGRDALYRFCAAEGIPHRRSGKLVVATHRDELAALAELEGRGRANGLQLRRVAAEELRDLEPHVAGIAGVFVPETGIVNFAHVAAAMARRIERGGGQIRTGARLLAIGEDGPRLRITTSGQELGATLLVNCGGLRADRIARACGAEPGVQIVPFRGEYYELVPERRALVRNVIYPVPDPRLPFLGVHCTRTVDDRVEVGPNAVLALRREGYARADVSPRDLAEMMAFPGFWRMAARFWRTGMTEVARSFSRRLFVRALQRLLPDLRDGDILRAGAGVRAQAVDRTGRLLDDFHILEHERAIHVLNAPSPAATASLSIGRHVAELANARLAM